MSEQKVSTNRIIERSYRKSNKQINTMERELCVLFRNILVAIILFTRFVAVRAIIFQAVHRKTMAMCFVSHCARPEELRNS